ARLADQDAVRAFPAARGLRSANLWDRPQGIVGDRAGAASAWAGRAHDRLAARLADLWRLLSLSSRKSPGLGRVCHRARLPEPVPEPVRGVSALQDASGDPAFFRGRAAHRL